MKTFEDLKFEITLWVIALAIIFCYVIGTYEYSTDQNLDRLSYRYDADGAFVVCDADSNKCGFYFGAKRIKAFHVSNADLELLGDVKNIPSVIIK